MKACRVSRDIAPLVLNFHTRWKWVVNCTPRSLPVSTGTARPLNSWCPLNRGLGGPHGPFLTFWRRETFLAPTRIRTADRQDRSIKTFKDFIAVR